MNDLIIQFLKDKIENMGMKYTFVSKKTGIDYQRLMRLFNQNAIISGSELICICKVIGVSQKELMTLPSMLDISDRAKKSHSMTIPQHVH